MSFDRAQMAAALLADLAVALVDRLAAEGQVVVVVVVAPSDSPAKSRE